MPQISIPFTYDPQTNQVFITIPYDVTDTGLGSETMTIPYTVNTVAGEPDIFIPVNVGGKTLSVPVDLEDPEIKLSNRTILGLPGINTINLPYYYGPTTGSGEITVWWEDYEYPVYPIDEPIWDYDPTEELPPILTYPNNPTKPLPYIEVPEIADDSGYLPTSDPYISVPYEPYVPEISDVFPSISVPLREYNVIEDNVPILAVDPPLSVTQPQILFPIDKPIPFTVDQTSEEPRILVDYTNVDGNIVIGELLSENIEPNANPKTEDLTQPLSSSGTNSGTTNLADQMSGLINNVVPNIPNIANIPPNPLSLLGVGEGDAESVAAIPYDFSSLSYPDNLGDTSFTGHYINFYINVTTSKGKYYTGGSFSYSDPDGSYSYSATSQGSVGGNIPGGYNAEEKGANVQEMSHQRISQAISLYIPDSMDYSQTIQWENANLLEAGKNLVQGIAGGKGGSKDKSDGQKIGNIASSMKSLSGAVGAAAAAATSLPGELVGNALGYALNPQLLVLFRAIGFRTFQYDFYFTPKNPTEAKAVRRIIRAFRFHAHPEINGQYGVFYIIPSTFDIEFIHKGKENKNIHKVKTCVLLKYDIDYAPFGWATYTDGMPVQTRLSLQFQETQIVTKSDIEKGY
nr:MAG: hypothetical protein [Caudoviricetes sp.]